MSGNLDMQYFTVDTFDWAFDRLYRHLRTAIRLDDRELSIAISKISGRANAAANRRQWAIVQQEAHQAWADLLLTFRNSFAPSVEVPQQLMSQKVPVWDTALQRLRNVEEQMQTLTVAQGWQGSGASSYRSTLPDKEFKVAQTIALATNARLSVEAVAMIQATVNTALFTTLLDYVGNMHGPVSKPPRTRWRNGFFRKLFSGKNRDQYNHEFFERTIYATQRFRELTQYIRNLADPDSADWASAARGIGMSLGTVSQVTQAGHVSGIAMYDGNATVKQGKTGTSSWGLRYKR